MAKKPDKITRKQKGDLSSGGRDRSRVASAQGYELGYFARKHGISRDQARELIQKIGNDRSKLNAAAQKLKG